MSWAARRRLFILLIIGAVVVAFLATLSIATFYDTPTCSDSVQNQDESGIDCGGSCAYLCTAELQPPTVLFAKAMSNSAGRTDVIALVENKNATAAAKDVPYRIQLYSKDRFLIQEVSGTLDVPPATTVPIFVPGIVSGKQAVANVFLIIDPASPRWFTLTQATDTRRVPTVSDTRQGGTPDAPRVEATFSNPGVTPLADVRAIVFVRDERGDVIAASSTVVPAIPAQEQAVATFTWNSAFRGTPVLIEVIPVIPLLDRQTGLP